MGRAISFRNLLSHWESYETDDFCAMVNDLLGAPDAAWEYGPDPTNPDRMLFSLSIRNDAEWAAHVCNALEIPFQQEDVGAVLGIPPRQWERYFEYTDRTNTVQDIDGESWLFELSPADERDMIRLGIFADLPEAVDWFDVVSIMLIGELGETNVSARIAQIYQLSEPQNLSPLSNLKSAFARHFPNCHFRDFLLGS